MTWELFEHTADLGLRVRAPTLDALLAQAGEGLFAMIAETGGDEPGESIEIQVAGERRDWLLFDWLNELLWIFESRGLLLRDFAVTVTAAGLSARATGVPFDPQRHRALHEVKAITYHRLTVEHRPPDWFAEVVVDI